MSVYSTAVYLTGAVLHLITQSWQIAVLTVAVAVITFALRHRSAHVRYLLWLIIVLKCVVPPLHTAALRVLPGSASEGLPAVSFQPPWSLDRAAVMDLLGRPVPMQTLGLPPPTPQVNTRHTVVVTVPRPWPVLWAVVSVWLIGTGVYLMMNLLRALRGRHWLRKTRRPLPEGDPIDATSLSSAFGIRHLPRIWIMDGVGRPFVWGLLRGSIYLPPEFFTIENPGHRRDILAHEISHVLRCDAAVNTLQVAAQALFWFHPLVWWVNRRIRQEREKCCDEMVLARLHTAPKDYSAAIVEAIARARESTRPIPSLAVAGPLKSVEERIRTMLRPGRRFQARPSMGMRVIVALIALGTVPTTFALTTKPSAEPAIQSPDAAAQPTVGHDTDPRWEPGPTLALTDQERPISGTWLLYMTPQGHVEQEPEAIDVRYAGSHVSFLIWQQDYSIRVSGSIQGGNLQLSGDSVYYGAPVSFSAQATVTGDAMIGTYSCTGIQGQAGTFRAVRGDGKKTKGWVRVANADSEYSLDFYVWDLIEDSVFITSVTVSGPHIGFVTLPTSDGTQTSVSIGGTKPLAGEVYTFTVGYSDGTREVVTASVRDTMVDSPVPLSPGQGDVVDTLTPTFSWFPGPNGCQGYYRLWVSEVYGNTVWSIYLPKEATSVVYNSDGKGFPLQPGDAYEWRLIAFDQPILGGPDNNVWAIAQFSTR